MAHHHLFSNSVFTIASVKDGNVAILNLLHSLPVKTRINQHLVDEFSHYLVLSNKYFYCSVEQGNKIILSTYMKLSAIGLCRYIGQGSPSFSAVKQILKFEDKILSAKLYLEYS